MPQPTPQQLQGERTEQQALEYLQAAGLYLIERNYRCRFGEIDLVMADNDVLVFVEVRFRRNRLFGGPAASVDSHKQRRLIATAEHFLQYHRDRRHQPARFDLIAVTEPNNLEWIQNAIEM